MKCLVAFICLVTAMVASQTFRQPHHSNLNQNATVVCSGNGTRYELIFFLESNGDRIDRIYTVNQTDEYLTGDSTFSDTSGHILGDGSAEMPYNFTIIADGMLPNALQLSEESKYSLAVIEGDVLSVYVMAKSVSEAPFFLAAYFPEDVIYKVSCNFSTLEDVWVSTGKIDVQGEIYEDPALVVESAKMFVTGLSMYGRDPTPINTTQLGESIQLNLALGLPSKATGLYARNCYVCNGPMCPISRLALPFIDEDGCPIGNPISKFTVDPVDSVLLTTKGFTAFVLSTGNEVYFACQVNFCYSENDLRCIDFCEYSNTTNTNNRRRRSAEEEKPDETVSAHITITIDSDKADDVQLFRDHLLRSAEERACYTVSYAPKNQEEPLVNNALLGLVIGLSAVLTIGLTAAIVVWCRVAQTASLPKA